MTSLTKSRFMIATECPRVLQYQTDPGNRYPDASAGDEFLESLAEGGHQVGALARLMYRKGHLVADVTTDDQVATTSRLLRETNVTVFEAAIRHQNLLIRCDILEKIGDTLKLIEVKSSGYSTRDSFRTSKGAISSEWKPYLFDVTYQAYVLEKAYPKLRITPYLMLLDKSVTVDFDGLSAKLPVTTKGRQVSVTPEAGFDATKLCPRVLIPIDVSAEVLKLRNEMLDITGAKQSFDAFVDFVASGLREGGTLPKNIGTACKKCAFHVEPAEITADRRSGWHECMAEHYGHAVKVSRKETVFGLYDLRESALASLLKSEPAELMAVSAAALAVEDGPEDSISRGHRRELQWKEHRGIGEPFIIAEAIRAELDGWRWPLHFIDFETSRPALPYHAGRTPYDQILFQFSHHVLELNGRLEHRTQFLEARPGVAPSIRVLRELKQALSGDEGTVIHWYPHERTVLGEIRNQLLKDGAPDSGDLLSFVESLIGPAGEKGEKKIGRLADLGHLVSRTVFYPGTGGSSSIKKILPAILRFSEPLRQKYSAPVYGTPAMPSKNFVNARWVVMDGTQVRDPYELLDPMFRDGDIQQAISGFDDEANDAPTYVANGGAALIAFDQLQRPDLTQADRTRLESQLYRYCELDTLAMVMVYEALRGYL